MSLPLTTVNKHSSLLPPFAYYKNDAERVNFKKEFDDCLWPKMHSELVPQNFILNLFKAFGNFKSFKLQLQHFLRLH